MFKKRAEKRKNKVQSDLLTLELIDFHQQSLADIEEKFAAIEATKDPAEKIVQLDQLDRFISNIEYQDRCKRSDIAYKHAYNRHKIAARFGAAVWIGGIRDENHSRNQNALNELPSVSGFRVSLGEAETRRANMIDGIITGTDLEDFARSPALTKAFKNHEELRDRFAVAAAVRAALGETRPQGAPAPEKKPKKSAAPAEQRAVGSYEHFRNF